MEFDRLLQFASGMIPQTDEVQYNLVMTTVAALAYNVLRCFWNAKWVKPSFAPRSSKTCHWTTSTLWRTPHALCPGTTLIEN
jgi:hypothetical protein